jgi:predicted Zn-dependent peptidase
MNAQFKLPKYETYNLENGLTVYLLEKKDVPLISMSFVVNAGSLKDGENFGLASFTAEALKFGTENFTKSQIDSIFNFYGSELSASSGYDFTIVNSTIIKDYFDKLFNIFSEVILKPKFEQNEINKRKQRWIAELEQAKESPRNVIGNYFNRLVFSDGYYSNPPQGLKSTIDNISRELIQSFYEQNYHPEHSAVVLVGDFNSSEMKNKINNIFGKWNPQSDRVIYDVRLQLKPFDKPRVYLVDKDNSFETTFMIGGQGIPMNNPDKIKIDVINTILGGRFTSWLNDELRVNAGLTYGARSRFASYRYAGTFAMSSFTQTKNTEAAIDLALKTYNRLFEKGIDEATLTSAKNYIKGQFPPNYETSNQLASFFVQKFIYGLDDSYINDFEKEINTFTVEEANRLVQKYFPKDNLQFTIVGKASEIEKIVTKYGEVIKINIQEDRY